jgi:hypothetical protein
MKGFTMLVISFLALVAVYTPPSSPGSQGGEIFSMLEARSKLPTNYTIQLVRTNRENDVVYLDEKWTIRKLGDKIRIDKSENKNHLHVHCRNCVQSGYVVETTLTPESRDSRSLVAFRSLKDIRHDLLIDWRYLGLFQGRLLQFHRRSAYEVQTTRLNPKNAEIKSTDKYLTISYLGNSGSVKTTHTYTKSKNWHLVKSELEGSLSHGKFNYTTTTEYTDWHGHEYPKKLVFSEINASNQTNIETIDILEASFESPDEKYFTLEGLGLNEGQAIAYPELPLDQAPIWRNGKVDMNYTIADQQRDAKVFRPDTNQPTVTNAPYTTSQKPYALIVGIVAIVCSLVTIAYVFLKRRRSAAT